MITTNGSSVLSTTQSKFGGYSGYFSAAANTYLTTSASSDFGLGSGNFTIEFWLNADAAQGSAPTVICNNDGTWGANAWSFLIDNAYQNTGKPSFFCYNYNTGPGLLVGNTNLKGVGWTHVAIVRSGNTFYLFLNGTQDATNTFSGSLDNAGSNYVSIMGTATSNFLLKGYIDELRITKGTALYTSTFTPPNRPFGIGYPPLSRMD